MKTKNSIVTYLRASVGCAFFAAAAALAFVATTTNVLTTHDVTATMTKASVKTSVSEAGAEMTMKDGSVATPLSFAEEAAAMRAFPAEQTPFSLQLNAITGWRRFQASSAANQAGGASGTQTKVSKKNRKQPPEAPRFNTWSSVGPSTAILPNILSFTGSSATTSGRITALALDTRGNPAGTGCTASFCRVWIGAAGGGVWRTDNALSATPTWTFLTSLNVMSNAIGSLAFYWDSNGAHCPNAPFNGTCPGVLYVGTGEGNASADSEAGLGMMRSIDGGNSWTILNAQTGPITTFSNGSGSNGTYTGNAFFGRAVNSIAIDTAAGVNVGIPSILYVGSVRSVRGVDETYGGPTSNPPVPRPPFGLWKTTDGGNTFTFVWDGGANCPASCVGGDPQASIRGVHEVKIDPNNHNIVYASAFPGFSAPTGGIWRSGDGGTTWGQILPPTSLINVNRCSFDVNNLGGGNTRMYAGCGDVSPSQGGTNAQVYRSDNANGAAAFINLTAVEGYRAIDNYCTAQCWYDNVVYTPPGFPDIVYIGGSYTYAECGHGSDCRGVVYATDAGTNSGVFLGFPGQGWVWSDATWDAQNNVTPAGQCCQPNAIAPNGIHPDQHAILTVPGNPLLFFEGSDGGIVRSSGTLSDISGQCNTRTYPPGTGTLAQCDNLLGIGCPFNGFACGVPTTIFTGMNAGLADLQFMSVSFNWQNRFNIQGGTQDNGTFQTFGSSTWTQEIYGDGGQSGFGRLNSNLRFNTFTGQIHDSNFQNGAPTKWVIASQPIFVSPEGANFYPPIIGDPNPAAPQTIYEGSRGIWRTQDWGGNQAFLEANCPEFTTSAAQPGCGDYVRLGGAPGTNNSGDLEGTFYGATRVGGVVNAIARTTANTSTAWAGSTGGRLFVSFNVDGPAAAVVWNRADFDFNAGANATGSPSRVVTDVAIDPNNTSHAWVTYSGYSAVTPSQPGHVFSVTWNASGTPTITNISFNLPDIPLTSVVFDPVTGDLYTASDFAVFRMKAGTTTWDIAGTGMPIVEVPHLTINPGARVLYAATHGLSVWTLPLY